MERHKSFLRATLYAQLHKTCGNLVITQRRIIVLKHRVFHIVPTQRFIYWKADIMHQRDDRFRSALSSIVLLYGHQH